MGLPSARDLNCSPGATAITAAVINDIQDCIVGLNNLVTGLAQGFWTSLTFAVAVTFNAAVTFLQDLTLASNKNVVLQGTGKVKHGTWTKIIAANGKGNVHSYVSIDGSTIGGWEVMIDEFFQAGDVITEIRVNVTDNAGGTRAQARVQQNTDGTASETDITGGGAKITSGTAGTLQQLSFTGLSESIAAGKTHRVQVLQTGGSATITWWSLEIDWTL